MSAYDALRACFPAGTLSGAPKIRAMEIISELEPDRRGPYGAVGYFDFSGNMDTAITIRTIAMKGGVAYIQAGGGVVYDSVPDTEYQETLTKARATLAAIEQAEAMEETVLKQEARATDGRQRAETSEPPRGIPHPRRPGREARQLRLLERHR